MEEITPKIRRANPEDAEEIVKVFNTLYAQDHGYTRPEVVKSDIENPRITSLIAVDADKKEIIGHGQLRPPEYAFTSHENDAVEIARLGVSKKHQNKGVGRQLVSALQDFTLLQNPAFVFADINTATDYSQKTIRLIGLKPVALLLGYSPDFAKINQANSFLVGMRIDNEQAKDEKTIVYVPEEHRKLAELVYRILGLKRDINEKSTNGEPLMDFDLELAGYVFDSQKAIKSAGYNPGQIAIDISQPSALEQIQLAEQAGLVVEGLVPLVREQNGTRHDKLIMSYLPNLDLNKVQVCPDYEKFSKMVLESQRTGIKK